jgi:hypothetical protein
LQREKGEKQKKRHQETGYRIGIPEFRRHPEGIIPDCSVKNSHGSELMRKFPAQIFFFFLLSFTF